VIQFAQSQLADMKSYQLLLGAFLLSFTLLPSQSAHAGGGTVTIKPDPVIDKRILVSAVDLKAGTIVVKYMRDPKEANHTYKIDDLTALTVDNQTGKINQIKVGMQVRGYTERDNDTLDSIAVGKADPAPIQPK